MDKDILSQIESLDELIPRPTELLPDECLICECFCVAASDIREVCQGHVDLELLKTQFNLGSGCQSCVKTSDSWINKIFGS